MFSSAIFSKSQVFDAMYSLWDLEPPKKPWNYLRNTKKSGKFYQNILYLNFWLYILIA